MKTGTKTLALAIAAVLLAASAPAQEGASGIAVVIGIDGYETLGALTTCRNDAREFAAALVAGGFPENRVVLLTDDAGESANRATLATMRRRIEQAAKLARESDTLIVYFSGHGVTRDNEGYLVPSDGDPQNAVALSWVKSQMESSRAASRLLVIDACHAGSGAKGVGGIAPALAAGTTGLAMLLSSAADEVSYPLEGEKRSVFSKYLVEGLAGPADSDGDRTVTAGELFAFVESRLVDWSLSTGKTQTPVLFPKAAPAFAVVRIPDVPTLSVTAIDSVTGAALSGVKVLLDGREIGTVPVTGRQLEKGRTYKVEVRGEMLEAYTETLVVSRGGPYSVSARLVKVTMRVPSGFRAAPGTTCEPYTNTGWAKEVVHEKTGMEMVFVPAGEFMMGSPSSEEGRDSDEGPQHRVVISRPFYIGKYEVTQGEWLALMGTTIAAQRDKADASWPLGGEGSGNPMYYVSWDECQEYARKAGDGLRFPAEGEWEYACRGGTTGPYHVISLDAAGWYDGNSGGTTHEVGQKAPNNWGVYDMHGNVWEWCGDWYGEYPSGSLTDPSGPRSGSYRVLRGGSWFIPATYCHSAVRYRCSPDSRLNYLGFRLARTIP